MRRARFVGRLAACLATAGVLACAGPIAGQPAQPAPSVKPKYLAYLDFAATDSPEVVSLKHAYNDAVSQYNRALYDYFVTLERHDRLVELHASSPDPAEKRKARDDARPLRARLTELSREVKTRATAVDQAARRAAVGGVPLTR